jgi:hypothetical protein
VGSLLTVLACALGMLAAPAEAQQTYLSARGQWWSLPGGHLGTVERRAGVELEMGRAGRIGGGSLSVGWVPQGDVRSGLVTAFARTGLAASLDRLRVGADVGLGALHHLQGKRAMVAGACSADPLCMSEAPQFERGWHPAGQLSASVGVELASGLSFHLRRGWLISGALEGPSGSWNVGLGMWW